MKRGIRNINVAVLVIMAVFLFSGKGHAASAAAVPVIAGNEKMIYLDGKDSISIEGEYIVSVVFTSSESNIATISQTGIVEPKQKGKTTIRATVVYKKKATGKNYTSNLSYKLTVLGKAAQYFTYDFRKEGGKTYEIKGLTQEGKECKNLYIPSYIDGRKVTSVGWGVLDGSEALRSLYLPDTIQRWWRGSRESCPNLKKIFLGESMRGFGYGTYLSGCPSLSEIILDSRNENFCVEKNVLFTKNKTKLLCYPAKKAGRRYKIPDEVTKIESNAFYGCKKLRRVTFTDNLETLEHDCFAESGLTAAIMPDEIKYLGGGIFSGCDSLEEVRLSKKFTEIPYDMFKNCISLKELTIPANVSWINNMAFSGCTQLAHLEVASANKNFCSKDGIVFSKSEDTLKFYPSGKKDSSFTVPEGIKIIGEMAFYGCKPLKEIVLPEGLEIIEPSAFYGCKGISELTIPNSVHTLGRKALKRCGKLSKVTLSDSLTEIPNGVFASCISLTEIMIPKEVSSIDVGAFRGCSNLKRFLADDENTTFTAVDGILFSSTMQVLYCYPHGKAGESYTVPGSVKRLKEGAFMQAEWLEKVFIPDTVKYVESQCFLDCKRLKTVRLPDKLTEISVSLFHGCESLTEVQIPSSVSVVFSDAFKGCNSLTEIKIPDSVREIGRCAFYSCENLNTVTIGTGVKYISSKAFAQCRKVAKMVIKTTKIKEGMVGNLVFAHTGAENGKKFTVEVPPSKKAIYTVYFQEAGLSKNAVIL